MDMVNTMIISFSIFQNLSRKVLLSACCILNKIPSKENKQIPYEFWKGNPPKLCYFRVWGYLAKIGILEPKRKKIGP